MTDVVSEIKANLKEGKLVIGAKETLSGLRDGTISKVYLAKNCPEERRADIEHHASLSEVEVVDVPLENVELGDTCKKPFAIAVIGLKK